MFKPNDLLQKGTAAVLEVFRRRSRGTVVTYAEIEEASGMVRDSSPWPSLVRKVKKEVRKEKGQTLIAIPNIGYRIETKHEQLHTRSLRLQGQATRRLTRDVVELEAMPDAELSEHQRTVKHAKIDQAKAARKKVLHSLRIGHQLSKPSSSGMPRVK